MKIPAGTVTLLFTDIEGSTRLWEDNPTAMGSALAAHDAVIRKCIESHSGFVFKTVGDAFCASFSDPKPALAAALAIQQSLAGQSHKSDLKIKVRVAIHTGEVELRGRDYFGPTLSRISRILSAGHGGQILLTSVTGEMVTNDLPEAAALKDLGHHRFRDLFRSERIFQLLHPALQAEFGPLKSLSEHRHNLPIQLTSLIGREEELAELHKMLRSVRLLTLTGTGGCGKTRLAYHLAAEEFENFEDGVWLVELATVVDPELVPQAVTTVLGLRDDASGPMLDMIIERIEAKSMLLILDNCEHLVDAVADFVAAILKACPAVKVLATSRESLRLPGEHAWRTPSLDTPDEKSLSGTPEDVIAVLNRCHGTRLMIERATTAQPKFRVTPANSREIAEICRRLDGIPLAIELAAARTKILTPGQIAERLADRFKLLIGGDRTLSRRQQTLRAAIDWSYLLLEEAERSLLSRLSVFAGGWTLDAAEQVCADDDTEDESKDDFGSQEPEPQNPTPRTQHQPIHPESILDLLGRLTDKSLVIADDTDQGFRYRMLQTIREYAAENLAKDPGERAVRDRHVRYFLDLSEESAPHIPGSDQAEWVARLEMEHDNIRAALDWCRRNSALAESALKMATAMGRFWHTRGYFTEGRRRLAEALVLGESKSQDRLIAKAHNTAGILAWDQGDHAAAAEQYDISLPLWRKLGDLGGEANTLNNLGLARAELGDFDLAESDLMESLRIRETLESKALVSMSLVNLGTVSFFRGDLDQAERLFNESLQIRQSLGLEFEIGECIHNLGEVEAARRNPDGAAHHFERSLEIFRRAGDSGHSLSSLCNLAEVAHWRGHLAASEEMYLQCLADSERLGRRSVTAASLIGLGNVARSHGDVMTSFTHLKEGIGRAIRAKALDWIAAGFYSAALALNECGSPVQAVTILALTSKVKSQSKKAIYSVLESEIEATRQLIRSQFNDSELRRQWLAGFSATPGEGLALISDLLHTPSANLPQSPLKE